MFFSACLNLVHNLLMHPNCSVIYLSCARLWTAKKHNPPLTECVFAASGVDAVGEVVMCVDILPQPNGEHKISVKGKKKRNADQTATLSFIILCSVVIVFSSLRPLS